MKRWQKAVLLGGLAALLAGAAMFGLRVYRDSRPGNSNTVLNETYGLTVPGINNRQLNDLLNGKATARQVRDELGVTQMLEHLPAAYAPGGTPTDVTGLSDRTLAKKRTEALDYCAAELYSCAADLLEQMGQMKQTALQEWRARAEDQRTPEQKVLFGLSWLEEVYAVEVEADHTVKGVLDRYRAVLEQWGMDTAPLDEFWDIYCQQKTEIKMFYLNKYLG